MTTGKKKISFSIALEDQEKLESIAAENGLSVSHLLGSIAVKVARGGILAKVCLKQPDGTPLVRVPTGEHWKEMQHRRLLESLIKRHEGTSEELREGAKQIERQVYMDG